MKRRYSSWLPYIAGMLMILLTARLGIWQWNRAAEKEARMQAWSTAEKYPPTVWQGGPLPGPYRRLVLTGEWLLPQQILLDNKIEEGQVGFHVITPLIISTPEGVRIIAVNRGWIAKPVQGLPRVPLPTTKAIIVRGEPLPRFFELSNNDKTGVVWQNLDWPEYQNKVGKKTTIFYAVAVSDLGDGLVRKWPMPNAGRDRNQGYAFQWFTLSLLVVILMGYFALRSYRRYRQRRGQDG